MTIFSIKESSIIREKILNKFINENDSWYKEKVALKYEINGERKTAAYYWEGIISPQIINLAKAYSILEEKFSLLLMWDDNLFTPKNLLYPNLSVISLSYKEFLENKINFPEDIYLFDSSFSWIICLTHETGLDDKEYCLFSFG